MRQPPPYSDDSQSVTLMGTFNSGGAEVLRKAASLRHFSPPLRALITVHSRCSCSYQAISFRVLIDRISDITSPTSQDIPHIHIPIDAGLFLNSDGEPTDETTNIRDTVFGFVLPSRQEFRLR
jgi:hypothetical protein